MAHSQDQQPPTEVDLSVKGVGLGKSYAVVLRKLGGPLSRKREKIIDEDEVCGPSHTSLRLKYEGVVVELHGDLQGRDFDVVSMKVTSPRWTIAPGIKIGMTEKQIRSKLGEPWQAIDRDGYRVLNYVTKGNDGGVGLYFRNDRLARVEWGYVLC